MLCAAIGVALLAIVILAGYEGGGSALDNLAPTFILIDFWVGLAFASVLFGDLFRVVQPLARDPAAGHPALSRALGPLPRRASRCSASPGSSSSRAGAMRPRT